MQHIWLVYLPGNQYSWASSMLMQWWTSVRGNSSCILQAVWHVWPLVILCIADDAAMCYTDHWPRLTTGDTVYCWWCSHVFHWSTDHWVAAQICSSLVQSCYFCFSFFLNLSEKVGAVYVREHVMCSSTRELADEQMIILSFNRTVTSQILSPERAL